MTKLSKMSIPSKIDYVDSLLEIYSPTTACWKLMHQDIGPWSEELIRYIISRHDDVQIERLKEALEKEAAYDKAFIKILSTKK